MTRDSNQRTIPRQLRFSECVDVTFRAPTDTAKKAGRTFEMVAYTGEAVNGEDGVMIVDMEGLDEGGGRKPILRDHDHSMIVGYSTEVEKTKELVLKGRVTEKTEHGRQVAELADEGFPWQASIGFAVKQAKFIDRGDSAEVNGHAIDGPATVITESALREVSFVPAGADGTTSATVFAADNVGEIVVDIHKEQTMETNELIVDWKANHADAVEQIRADGERTGREATVTEAELKADKQALEDERGRCLALAKAFADKPEFLAEQIAAGHDTAKAKSEHYDVLAAEHAKLQEQLASGDTSAIGFAAAEHSDDPPADENAPDPEKDPKAAAEWEWDHDEKSHEGFSTKERYVAVRSHQLAGNFRMLTGTREAEQAKEAG